MNFKLGLILSMMIVSGAALLYGQDVTKAVPKILFVCEHGAAKSIIAAAEFERLAKEKGLSVQVISRGTVPDAEIAPGVRQGLLADGVSLGAAKPVKISAKDLNGATRIVSFGPDLAEWNPKGAKVLDWSAAPSPSKDYTAARDYIRKQVQLLLLDVKPN